MRATIKFLLRPLRPETLTDAYWLAVDIEQATPARKPYPLTSGTQRHTTPYYKQPGAIADKGAEATQPMVIQRAREPGKCWRYGDSWFHGHKCKQAPVINLLTGEDPTELPTTEEPEEMTEIDQPEQPNAEENCMQISLQAMNTARVSTLSVLVQIGGKQAVALVDSGSNSTFLNLTFTLTTNCTILKDKSRAVTIAGGGMLRSGAYVPTTKFQMGKEQFAHPFRILHLPGYDMVIGLAK